MKRVISLDAISRVEDMMQMMRQRLETTGIGVGVTEQQCSAGAQTHG
jgi:hypothetical protein